MTARPMTASIFTTLALLTIFNGAIAFGEWRTGKRQLAVVIGAIPVIAWIATILKANGVLQ